MERRRTATIAGLAAQVHGAVVIGPGEAEITGITYDSRAVKPGDLFAALRGADLDGHDFLAEAEARGAAALLVESPAESRSAQIVVGNSRAALASVSAAFFGQPSREIGVIGVTGTDGKTTTSFLIDHLLRSAGMTTGLIGTVAVRIGDSEDLHATRQTTPESNDMQRYLRAMVEAGAEWATVEATSHGLAMHRLDHIQFQVGAVTNITHEHLDFHGTIDNYRRAKAMLLERVATATGRVVLNLDDAGARAVAPYARGAEVTWYSGTGLPEADIQTHDVTTGAMGSTFELQLRDSERARVELPLIGDFNIANAVCAAGVALAAGLSLDAIARGLATAPAVPGRMALVNQGQPFSVVVDYAHTPESLGKVLRLLRGLHPDGRLIVVFGSAGERDVAKRPVQGRIAAELADVAVVTSEDPRGEDADAIIEQIAAGAVAAGSIRDESLFQRTDRRDAIALAIEIARPGDCVLLAGKGHEGSIIWGREKLPWNEAEIARELLAAAGFGATVG
ncbi:MAG: UDP-N-acetylmuramoyl-L-alanyl-D-glutamate--2,6-diaminopimelate ligase [Thermomicrobiales bacterium]